MVHTTDNRDWELNQGATLAAMRAAAGVAVDMESATIAANGFRYRIPNATLLCVSDKPLHGVPEARRRSAGVLRGLQAPHLAIALDALDRVRLEHPGGAAQPGTSGRVDEPLLGGPPDL